MDKDEFLKILTQSGELIEKSENLENVMPLETFIRLWRMYVEDVPYESSLTSASSSLYYANISKHYYFHQLSIILKKEKGGKYG